MPLGEEILFRGFLLTVLFEWFHRLLPAPVAARRAILIGAVSFGLGHLGNLGYVPTSFVLLQVITAVLFGLLAGWLRLATASLVGPVLLHATLNITADA